MKISTPDLGKLPHYVRRHRLATISTKDANDEYTNETVPTEELEKAEVITSEVAAGALKGWHRPILDIDLSATILPSSTFGHGHLYINKAMPWEDYEKLLNVLAEVGIIEQGYADASIEREHTAVRLPWVRKDQGTYEEIDL
jgi:hypothetical protein